MVDDYSPKLFNVRPALKSGRTVDIQEVVVNKCFGGLLFALMLVMVAAGSALAETRYVTDQLIIIMRAEPDDGAASVKSLTTDAAVVVLGEAGDYLKVRATDGKEGYVKERYITKAVPKSVQIDKLAGERDRLQQEVTAQQARIKQLQTGNAAGTAELEQELDQTKQDLVEARKTGDTAAVELAALQKKYTTLEQSSGNVLQVVADREKLQNENDRLVKELETLQEEHTWLVQMTIAKWALTGAGILLIGWLMGKASRTRRRY